MKAALICLFLAIAMLLPVKPARALPAWLELDARLTRARVPACPREQAQGFRLQWQQGRVTGQLEQLSLDLACSRSGNRGAEGEADALSLLLTLPPIRFSISRLTLYLPAGELSGPAQLQRQDDEVTLSWHTAAGAVTLVLVAGADGWRWQGQLPGRLLLPALTGAVEMQGSWQPGQVLRLRASTGLPVPLTGTLKLDAGLTPGQNGWQWQAGSRVQIDELGWRALRLSRLELQPLTAVPLNGQGQWQLTLQGGSWRQQALPAIGLILSLEPSRQGSMQLWLAPELQLKGRWQWQQGLALTLPRQRLPLPALSRWLQGWLVLPEVDAEQGELWLSGRLPAAGEPVTLNLTVRDGRLRRGELVALGVAGQLELKWRPGQLLLAPGAGLSAAELNVGVPITDLHAALDWRQGAPWLSGLTASTLGGGLALSPMRLGSEAHGELHLQDISLAHLLSLAGVAGLTGDGRLHGRLPFAYDGRLSVAQGRLHGQQGWISYQAGESLQARADDNLSLALTLGMLSDLRYDRLQAEVTMAPDGEAVIDSRLQGQAPVMGKMHGVEFNYRHQENLLQLLESLRFAGKLSERLPAGLQGEKRE